jgi:5-methylcytosine-specific restriction enzyme A
MSPIAARRPCLRPGCPHLAEYRGRCAEHARGQEQGRPNADVRQWYHSSRWQDLRTQVLSEEPLCRIGLAEKRVEASTDVDHIVPHRGDPALFWERRNLQGLCHECHSRKTQGGH